MAAKKRWKLWIDILMTVLLLFVMAYQVTGSLFHELLGAAMLLLFLAHNVLNRAWYGRLLKGRYTPVRVLWTVINLLTLLAIAVTGYSGIAMSKHLFAALPLGNGTVPVRELHLAGSYWSFVLMSCHLGLHWSMVATALRRHTRHRWPLRIAGILLAVFGVVRFWQKDILSYMILKNRFVFLDYDAPSLWVLFENLAIMAAFVCIVSYAMGGLMRRK